MSIVRERLRKLHRELVWADLAAESIELQRKFIVEEIKRLARKARRVASKPKVMAIRKQKG